jgi:hypothetical protein
MQFHKSCITSIVYVCKSGNIGWLRKLGFFAASLAKGNGSLFVGRALNYIPIALWLCYMLVNVMNYNRPCKGIKVPGKSSAPL